MKLGDLTYVKEDLETTSDTSINIAAQEAVEGQVELEQDVNKIGEISDGIESGEQAIEQLTDIKEHAEAGETMSPVEQTLIQTSMESIMGSLGMSIPVSTTESLNSRRSANIVPSLEGVISDVVQNIIKAFKTAVETVIDFIKNLFRNSWLMLRYIKKVKEAVKEASGKRPSDATMSGRAASQFSVEGIADERSIMAIGATALTLIDNATTCALKIKDLNFSFGEEGTDQSETREMVFGKLNRTKKGYLGYMLNGRSFIPVPDAVRGLDYMTVQNGGQADVITIASQGDLLNYIDTAEEIINRLKKFDSTRSVIANAASRIIQNLTQEATMYGGIVSKNSREMSSNIGYIRGWRQVLNRFIGRYPLEAYKTAKALADYCKQCLTHYTSA